MNINVSENEEKNIFILYDRKVGGKIIKSTIQAFVTKF